MRQRQPLALLIIATMTVILAASAQGQLGSLVSTLTGAVQGTVTTASGAVAQLQSQKANGPRYIKDYDSRIVGGDTVSEADVVPYQVQILLNGTFHCSGAMVAAHWVLTTASCTVHPYREYGVESNNVVNSGPDEAGNGVVLGSPVSYIVPHPEYLPNRFPNDIALIRAANSLVMDGLGGYGKPKALEFAPKGSTPDNEFGVIASGWGPPAKAGAEPKLLREIRVKLVNDTACNAAYRSTGISIVDSMICAGQPGNNPCQGDSGSPLNGDVNIDGVMEQRVVGILSFGQGCGQAGYPAVYTKVSKYADWIVDTITRDSA